MKGKEEFDSSSFISFVYRWRKPLVIIFVITVVLSVIFSSSAFITPLFKSEVILIPTSTNSVSKALLAENVDANQDILGFGEDEQTEQMLQILNSNLIRDRIIRKFDLLKHYEIDEDSQFKRTKLIREYESNIKFRRTEYMAVKITVYDRDPEVAANMANTIADLVDSTKTQMKKERAMMGYRIVEAEYLKLQGEIQRIEDSLTVLRGLGVHDYESQVEMINQQYAIELANGNNNAIKRLEAKLDILARYGGPYVSLRDALEHEKKQLSLIKAKYEEAKVDAYQILPQKFVVNSAEVAEKKSYPVRWLIVIITTLSVLILSVIVLIFLDNIHRIKKKAQI